MSDLTSYPRKSGKQTIYNEMKRMFEAEPVAEYTGADPAKPGSERTVYYLVCHCGRVSPIDATWCPFCDKPTS